MKFIRGLHNVHGASLTQGVVATIGGFDGVHLGHQALLAALNDKARALHLPSMVISFEPSPREYFMKDDAPSRLQRWRDKFQALAQSNVDLFACLRFNAALQAMSADAFVETVLRDALQVRWLIVGHDFRFGRGRSGDVARLQALGAVHDFGVDEFPAFMVDQQRVSSTLIREVLIAGDLHRANALLGRPFSIAGRVVRGNQLGRTLGFPTANIRMHRLIALRGVFAVQVSGAGLHSAPAVASVGTRPVVNGTEPLLEVSVFNFTGDLYNRQLKVDFVARLRDEKWFPSLDALKEQMFIDAEQARKILRV
ncbi:MAG: bifunctional riboflavin kinase/FAD synthetase [Steroidobacter sp.]